jgi:hypothetical protein
MEGKRALAVEREPMMLESTENQEVTGIRGEPIGWK